MKLSYLFYKGILETGVGSLINKFKIHRRRDILFFEELISEYVKKCDDNNLTENLLKIGEDWGKLAIKTIFPKSFFYFPLEEMYNKILRKVWISIDLVHDIKLVKKQNEIFLTTEYESGTRLIGKNPVSIGFHKGMLEGILGKKVKLIEAKQSKKRCSYRFKVLNEKAEEVEAKGKREYFSLNKFNRKGFTTKEAIKSKVIRIKDDKLFLRGKRLLLFESTYFHLFGIYSKGIDLLPPIAEKFFNELVNAESTEDEKLRFLKHMLQFMGWGEISFLVTKDKVIMTVNHPNYGFQKKEDNWLFLIKMVEGFIKAIRKRTVLKSYNYSHGKVTAVYCKK